MTPCAPSPTLDRTEQLLRAHESPEGSNTPEITVIIHGNNAADDPWWRPGPPDSPTFADRLEQALAARSKEGTVWKPALAHGMICEQFAWSGQNSHRDRVRAAKRLRSNLKLLAQKLGATAERPLHVNLVAHSHGGNVCLQAMKHLSKKVRIRTAVLMGTPLLTATPTFRPLRFMLAPPLLPFMLLAGMALVVLLVLTIYKLLKVIPAIAMLNTSAATHNQQLCLLLQWLMVVALFPLIYGSLFRMACWVCDMVWRTFYSVHQKLTARRQRGKPWPVYGPSEAALRELLDGGTILHLSTVNDEGDVLLQTVVAPKKVYGELAKRFRGIAWWLGVMFRTVDLFLPCVECICEYYALGLTPFKALFFDHEIVDARECQYYSESVFVHESVLFKDAPLPATLGDTRISAVTVNTISDRILSVFEEISSRVPLRHSAYHESNELVERVAAQIAGALTPTYARTQL